MSVHAFQIGDVVRVSAARRRDVRFRIIEITETHIRAVNEADGEAYYEHDRFEPFVERSALETVSDRVPRSRVDAVQFDPVPAAVLSDAAVRPHPDEPIDATLKRFKRACERQNIMTDLKRHRAFVPKPQKRRLKSKLARARRAKAGLG